MVNVNVSYELNCRYWYHYGNLFPDMMTVWVAVDPSTKENGCLEVIFMKIK